MPTLAQEIKNITAQLYFSTFSSLKKNDWKKIIEAENLLLTYFKIKKTVIMNYIFKILCLSIISVNTCFSQKTKPVTWQTSVEKISDTVYNLVFTATIKDTWHLYSQNVSENGPLPTIFKFDTNKNYETIGTPKEQKGKTIFEKVFEMKVTYFEHKAIFKQRVKLITKNDFKLTGDIRYMSCDSKQCILDTYNFEIKI